MKTVYVGLSGGVDSAVSAALLKEAGYAVVGAFIKIWRPEFSDCPWRDERLDAMRVAAALGIPFKEIDLSEEYKMSVIDDLVRNYSHGITPNPDVLCNRHIKFGAFAAWAFSDGADCIATGHYARVEIRDGRPVLLKAVDSRKDQSYFLNRLSEKDLRKVLFPVGAMTKSQVRDYAKKYKLPVAAKPDSQGLCFVGAVDMDEFLSRILTVQPGSVLDTNGTVVGQHRGAALYTIGMRHGFSISAQSPDAKPRYVVGINTQRNTITVSERAEDAARSSIPLRDVHWVQGDQVLSEPLEAVLRYRQDPVQARLVLRGDMYVAETEAPHIAPPGQSMVLYRGDELVGSGIMQP